MSRPAGYVKRIGDLARAIEILSLHPDGLPITDIAAEIGVSSEELRETVLTYYRLDLVEYGLHDLRQPVVEFSHDGDSGAGPAGTEVLRLVATGSEADLGVAQLTSAQLADLHRTASDMLVVQPDDADLRSALDALRASLLPVEAYQTQPHGWCAATVRVLDDAARQHRRIRMGYIAAWEPTVVQGVLEPLRLLRTRRGWELDAALRDRPGVVRTFLVSGIRKVEVLAETFEPPPDVDGLIAANRRPTTVVVVVPQAARWAVHRFAERVEVLQEDEEVVKMRAELLPPIAPRLGLLLITAGPDAFVMEPLELMHAGEDLAGALLAHHAAGVPAP